MTIKPGPYKGFCLVGVWGKEFGKVFLAWNEIKGKSMKAGQLGCVSKEIFLDLILIDNMFKKIGV